MRDKVNIAEKLVGVTEYFSPKIVASLNEMKVEVVKVRGEFVWHAHPDTDDFFLVLDGELDIDLEDGSTVHLAPGQLFVVPRGVRHRPRARGEAHILLIEPTGTPNSGDPLTAAPRRVI
jgi:mannose-6-phosphate isomerase-like protein (cupin superfamily)